MKLSIENLTLMPSDQQIITLCSIFSLSIVRWRCEMTKVSNWVNSVLCLCDLDDLQKVGMKPTQKFKQDFDNYLRAMPGYYASVRTCWWVDVYLQ